MDEIDVEIKKMLEKSKLETATKDCSLDEINEALKRYEGYTPRSHISEHVPSEISVKAVFADLMGGLKIYTAEKKTIVGFYSDNCSADLEYALAMKGLKCIRFTTQYFYEFEKPVKVRIEMAGRIFKFFKFHVEE